MQQKNSFGIALLSVIVPAYKQEYTIIKDVKGIANALDELDIKYEIVIVIDGLVDNTLAKIKQSKLPNVKILHYEQNQGKGFAIRYGMQNAKGDVIGFIDAGMDIHTIGFSMLLNHMQWYNADIILGSKLHSASKVNYPFYRKVLSWGYRFLTATLFGFNVRDTQVGLKFFKREVIQDVLPRLLVKSYAFDIEILAVAHELGYTRIYEAPIEINFKENSITAKNLWKVIYHMLVDTAAVFYRLKFLHYYTKKRKFTTKPRTISNSS